MTAKCQASPTDSAAALSCSWDQTVTFRKHESAASNLSCLSFDQERLGRALDATNDIRNADVL
jgi:hypothetical protein